MRAAGLLLIAQSLAIIILIAHYAGKLSEERTARHFADATATRLHAELGRTTGQRDALVIACLRLRRHECGT